jgi:catechol 2,3-dioxygenase-like lactoylglutathione lyase family enzyme
VSPGESGIRTNKRTNKQTNKAFSLKRHNCNNDNLHQGCLQRRTLQAKRAIAGARFSLHRHSVRGWRCTSDGSNGNGFASELATCVTGQFLSDDLQCFMATEETTRRFRALHWVFKDPDRRKTYEFYRTVLGMKVLRHEEFDSECKASCNGPYDNRWSKTMYGFGPESEYFACELTYNYPIKKYALGNDLRFVELASTTIQERVRNSGWPFEEIQTGSVLELRAPGGYVFRCCGDEALTEAGKPPSKRLRTDIKQDGKSVSAAQNAEQRVTEPDPFRKISLHVTDIERSISFYRDELGMQLEGRSSDPEDCVRLRYPGDAFVVELVALPAGTALDHGEAYGRIAFSISGSPLDIEKKINENPKTLGRVQTPLVALDTPAKATVEVVILQDPDGYEICFVGESAFNELCVPDQDAEACLQEAMDADRSDEVPFWRAAPEATDKDSKAAEETHAVDANEPAAATEDRKSSKKHLENDTQNDAPGSTAEPSAT